MSEIDDLLARSRRSLAAAQHLLNGAFYGGSISCADYGGAEKTLADAREALEKATGFIERIDAYLPEQS